MTTLHEPAVTASADALSVWPASAVEPRQGELTVGGVPLAEVADRFGTPVYVLDEDEVRERCRTYRLAFPEADVLYAAKAFLCRAMARWVAEEGLGLDVCSAGELELAVTTGFPPERIVLHGNAKSPRHSAAAPAAVTVVGRHCEAGDVVADDVELPGDIRPGDLLAVPAAGAYHLSMASGYNLVGRPPVVAVDDGRARLLIRRESLEDIRSRDVGL
ncbi:hypothetical protein [Streptomyces caeruleatus]|uniref:Diaminopimelate decarboxylase n=1 Tax=Streptomyces caeruleatus TaxID=661399 RepID=A0A101TR62_9ACTN|nr:hypothetical protein [Streptomyces caeruleatus]KUN96957.1 hypothetical protein AQJ67_32855 [Streptomyces caeruleatus]